MIELRQVNCGDGSFRLEQRTRNVTCDASGAFAGFTEWSEWGPVPTVRESTFKAGDTVIIKCHDEGYVGQTGTIVEVFESGRCQVAVGEIAVLNLPPEAMEPC